MITSTDSQLLWLHHIRMAIPSAPPIAAGREEATLLGGHRDITHLADRSTQGDSYGLIWANHMMVMLDTGHLQVRWFINVTKPNRWCLTIRLILVDTKGVEKPLFPPDVFVGMQPVI